MHTTYCPKAKKIAGDFYQREMVKLNSSLEHVKIFINDAAMLGRDTFNQRIEELDEALTRMETSGLQVSTQKSKWVAMQAKCLGCVVSANGYSPDSEKTQRLVAMKDPKNKRQAR